VDEFSFGLLMNRTLGGSDKRRPSDKSANEVQVDMILGQAQNLAKMNDQYVETYVVRGTKELYALLGAIYSYALQINESVLKDHILQRMRDRLESDHDIKTQANTPWLTTVLRFILPMDRQTAYTYSKVLQVAHDENLAAQELPNYIKERGGIAKITATKEDAEAAKAVKTHKEAKTQMLRKILLANAKAANTVVQVDDRFVLNTVEEGKKEGTFEFAVCVNPMGQERRVVRFIKLNEAMETQILNMVAEASVSDDLATTQNNLDVLREKLGITSGWGMQPGDKGYQPAGLPALNSAVQPEAMINAPMEVAIAGVTVKEAMF
jgi:Rod binding domain-containing protein